MAVPQAPVAAHRARQGTATIRLDVTDLAMTANRDAMAGVTDCD
jgi:hypothetical protein